MTRNEKQIMLQIYSAASKDALQKTYYLILHNALKVEEMFAEDIRKAGKEIDDTLDLQLVEGDDAIRQEFLRLYDIYHPVRNNVETLDSIESVRVWMKEHPEFFNKLM